MTTRILQRLALLAIAVGPVGSRPVESPGPAVGTVRGVDGTPIQSARLSVVGSPIESRSDPAGSFSLSLPEGDQVLVVSHAGFAPRTVPVQVGSSMTPLDLVLEPLPHLSESVVVE